MTRCPNSKTAYRWCSGGASQKGGRTEQQDCWGVFQLIEPKSVLAIVADGMGGHLDGALAAQTIFDIARHFAQQPPSKLHSEPLAALKHLCDHMHDAINKRSESARSTIIMVWLHQQDAHWLNVGDSRLYHFRDGQRLMRTRDHSAVQLLMDLGEINESQMATHPAQNQLFRCLGGEEKPKPDTGHFTTCVDDVLALCSDGIWEQINEDEFWTASHNHEIESAAQRLTETAARRGGATGDNATLILLRALPLVDTDIAPLQHWLQRLSTTLASLFGHNQETR